jgi:hypothetical protein
MMFIVSIKFSKHVQNEISAKVMPKAQNFTRIFADEMKLSKATVSRLAKQMIKAGKIIKKSPEYFPKEVALVSHFRGTDRKHETSACFVGDLPMREALKTQKRDRR